MKKQLISLIKEVEIKMCKDTLFSPLVLEKKSKMIDKTLLANLEDNSPKLLERLQNGTTSVKGNLIISLRL